jgi:hypothetical protein
MTVRMPKSIALLALALLVAALIAGCGGSSSDTTDSADPVSSGGEATGSSASSGAAATNGVANVKAVESTVAEEGTETQVEVARFPNGVDNDEISTTGAKPIKPCALVPKKKAEGILGAGVKLTERIQGPTCVYTASGRTVTLAVEKNSLKQLREGAKTSSKVTAAGKTGWCLRYDNSSVVFAVSHGRVLQITGPCAAGVRFAAIALPRL